MSSDPLLEHFRQLDADEKLALIGRLWQEFVDEPGSLPVTEAQKRLLDERLKQHAENPADIVDWEVVRGEGEQRLKLRRR